MGIENVRADVPCQPQVNRTLMISRPAHCRRALDFISRRQNGYIRHRAHDGQVFDVLMRFSSGPGQNAGVGPSDLHIGVRLIWATNIRTESTARWVKKTAKLDSQGT